MLICGSVFSGIGLLDYGLHLAGLHHAWLCERDEWRRGILARRWPGARIVDDVRLVGGGLPAVDVIAGGFPCKGASSAGKREGFGHPETVLWREMARAIRELRPRYVLVENVAAILALHNGAVWGEVLGDLASLGYDIVWDCLPAGAVGAPHRRDRVFAVAAYADGGREPDEREGAALPSDERAEQRWGELRTGGCCEPVADAEGQRTGSAAGQAHAVSGGRDARQEPLRRGPVNAAPTDAARLPERGAGAEARPDRKRARPGNHAPTDAERGGQRQSERHVRPGKPDPSRRSTDAADAGGRRCQEQQAEHGGQPPRPDADALGRGVRVEWGDYGPAIRRWEAIHGPAPEPLVRRVDDRRAGRVERSRLSALGDGVQVQIGRTVGEYIIELERGRIADAA